MSNNYFKNADIDFKCPNCNRNITIKVSKIGSTITCPHCNQSIQLEDDGFSNGLKDANKMLDKFGQDLNNMFK